tara:strand:+ start:958 stop:1170 length:213 start_codon:yes stop_codon:yes gene_type:complete
MKPTITVKQQSHITTVKLKGVPFAFIITTNEKLQSIGIIRAIEERLESCHAKGFVHQAAKYQLMLKALQA